MEKRLKTFFSNSFFFFSVEKVECMLKNLTKLLSENFDVFYS